MLVKIHGDNKLYVTPLLAVLSKNNVAYSFSEGDIDFLVNDSDVFNQTNAYPNDVGVLLFSKKNLHNALSPFGFNTLITEIIDDPDVIRQTNFIVKMEYGTGGSVEGANNTNRFAGVCFKDKDAFKRHPLFVDYFKPKKYVAQQSMSVSKHTAVSIFCAVNSSSDIFTLKTSTDKWVNGVRVEASLADTGYEDTVELIATAVKTLGIKNTCFTLQFIVNDSKLYLMDWNFRWGRNFHKQVLSRQPKLYEDGILFMLGIGPKPVVLEKTVWLTTKEELASL